jgi:hypothetical protein
MFEHLFNCHGEWQALFAAASSVPFVGYWIRTKYRNGGCDEK